MHWTEEDIATLKKHWSKLSTVDIARLLGRTKTAVETKAYSMDLYRWGCAGANWSEKEMNYVMDNWGVVSIKSMAKKLNRTLNAVRLKARKLGLSDARTHHHEYVTLFEFAKIINTPYSTVRNWARFGGFPCQKKVFAQTDKIMVTKVKWFWEWAKNNKARIDLSRFDSLTICPEPEWAAEKRKADQKKRIKPHNTSWTKDEDTHLVSLVDAHRYSYTEIAVRLNRSEGAVKRRLTDLGLKARPVRQPNHNKWKPHEIERMVEMIEAGYHTSQIALEVGRTELAVRGKLERMNYDFRKQGGEGQWREM